MIQEKILAIVPKRARGRPKKIYAAGEQYSLKKVGLPAILLPTVHDVRDELSMLDSYKQFSYNK